MTTIDLSIPERACRYSIMIEPGLLSHLGECVASTAPHARAMLAVDAAIIAEHGQGAAQSLRNAGIEPHIHHLTASESRKTLGTIQELLDAMAEARLERTSPVIALGGGIVGDVAAFAASIYLRGVPVVHVPTTLLAMVDAAIGGKTGVNHRVAGDADRLGKNMVGTFWQPRAVLIDPDTLATLPARELRCGLAECVKHATVADAGLLAFLEAHSDGILTLDRAIITELIARSATIKIEIVQRDEREAGVRMLLNLGHTFAHAIELRDEQELRHGEAVSIGLAAAMHCAVATRRMADDERARVLKLLARLGLPTRLPQPLQATSLLHMMRHDKKVKDDRLRLVLPRGIGSAEVVDDVADGVVLDAWRSVGAR